MTEVDALNLYQCYGLVLRVIVIIHNFDPIVLLQAKTFVTPKCIQCDHFPGEIADRENDRTILTRPLECCRPGSTTIVDLHTVKLILRPAKTCFRPNDTGSGILIGSPSTLRFEQAPVR